MIADERIRAENFDRKTKYLTDRQVSALTGIALQTLRNWRAQSKGPDYAKLGRSVRYREDVVLAWMESHTIRLSE